MIWKVVAAILAILSLPVSAWVLFQTYALCRRCFLHCVHILFKVLGSYCLENGNAAVDRIDGDINNKDECSNEGTFYNEGADERGLNYGIQENDDNDKNFVLGNGAGEL